MGGQIASTATSGGYQIATGLQGGFFGWVVNTQSSTMALSAPATNMLFTNGSSTVQIPAPAGQRVTYPDVMAKSAIMFVIAVVMAFAGWMITEAMPYYEEAPWLIAAPTAVLLWLVAAMMLIQPEREAA